MPAIKANRTSDSERHAADAYFTIDPRPIKSLLKHFKPRGEIWEPAAGVGHLAWPLQAAGYTVHQTDLNDHGGIGVCTGHDFLGLGLPIGDVQTIVTNPPNKLNVGFARHAIELMRHVDGCVSFYQRHNWLCGSRDAAPLFDLPCFAGIIAPRFRPIWFEKKPGDDGPAVDWSWFLWDWKWSAPPVIRFG